MTKVRKLVNDQYIITIPKRIAEAMRLRPGDRIEWIFDRGDVIVRKV
jgi:AbrB family looped-hinge helix DNA binding protein